jgi:hypothetical protein
MVIKLKGYGTSITLCPRNLLYTRSSPPISLPLHVPSSSHPPLTLCRGCALVTTATSYFYLIAHPNPGDPNEFDITASLSLSERLERQNLLSPVQMTPSSPTTTTPMRSRSNSDSYVVGTGMGGSQPHPMSSAVNASPVPAVYYKHLNGGVPSAIACLADGVTLFVGDTSGSVTWYEMKNKEYSESHPGTYLPQARGRYVIEEGRTNVRVLHMQVSFI